MHRDTAEGRIPPLLYDYQKEKWAQAKRFGRYGLASGVDIRKLWPTVEEVEETKALRMHRSAQEAMKIAVEARQKEKQKVVDRLAEIERNFSTLPAKLKAFEDSQVKAEEEQDEKAKQLEKRIREIQEYFGYWIDPNDPRFEVMLKQKEAEEKKAARLAKKQDALKKSIASIVTSGES
ncbi:Protein K07A1.10 [Aphelenchoides avenae]|nr:Protein K07A1.10 [Aphelenchus avenae]